MDSLKAVPTAITLKTKTSGSLRERPATTVTAKPEELKRTLARQKHEEHLQVQKAATAASAHNGATVEALLQLRASGPSVSPPAISSRQRPRIKAESVLVVTPTATACQLTA